MISIFDRVENAAGLKEKMPSLPAFSPFPMMFSKALFLSMVKSQDSVVKC